MGNCLKGARSDSQSLLRDDTSMDHVRSSDMPPPYEEEEVPASIFNISSNNIPASNLSEEQQVRLAQRLGLIQHLPSGTYDGTKKKRECVICMGDFCVGDPIRFLPCMHIYHKECIDDWLLRSFTCPSCMESVDAALISTFYTSE
ncbi:RING finger protein 11-like [Hydractinia symbiolongicarpus]|uniref:RING finger protein 11-like n=1 Tax=Hydractinia symbiolongicarpus TaxID=13093 RepID=UPI00254F5534|nr:RING finger protein 11-like [Hydractinia symbiolongicarpus]